MDKVIAFFVVLGLVAIAGWSAGRWIPLAEVEKACIQSGEAQLRNITIECKVKEYVVNGIEIPAK